MNLYIEEGFQAGADDYIVKPFKVSTLKIRIKNILNRQEKMKKIYGKQLSLKSAGIEVESIDKAFVDKYIAIVKENISNPDFNIDQLCKELAISRANLYRKVKAITTLSPAEMIRNIRLECASELLRNSQLTATESQYKSDSAVTAISAISSKVYTGYLLKIQRTIRKILI